MRLLLVEDDPLLGDGLNNVLSDAGHTVDWVQDGARAKSAVSAAEYDALLLDLNLPDCSGLEVLELVRGRGGDTPVLVLTARDQVSDRVQALDAGADDYVVKPFDVDEVCARLRALSRRANGRSTPVLTHGDLVLDPAAHHVCLGDRSVALSPKEFTILEALMESAGRVLSRTRLEESLYGWGEEVESNAVEVHIHHLRRKLGSGRIRTIRGVGYILDGDG